MLISPNMSQRRQLYRAAFDTNDAREVRHQNKHETQIIQHKTILEQMRDSTYERLFNGFSEEDATPMHQWKEAKDLISHQINIRKWSEKDQAFNSAIGVAWFTLAEQLQRSGNQNHESKSAMQVVLSNKEQLQLIKLSDFIHHWPRIRDYFKEQAYYANIHEAVETMDSVIVIYESRFGYTQTKEKFPNLYRMFQQSKAHGLCRYFEMCCTNQMNVE